MSLFWRILLGAQVVVLGFGLYAISPWSESPRAILPVSPVSARPPASPAEVVWATPAKEGWDGWKENVVKMRADRKPQPASGYLYSEEVVWDSYHDINQSHLADGRVLSLEWKDKEWDVIDGWEKGRKLLLCYDETNGASLLDPQSSQRFPVSFIWKKDDRFSHPIDDYLVSLNALNTYDMMSAGYEAIRLWQLEIDRMVRKVLAKKYLPKKERDEFIALTAARVRYCELQTSFGAAAIHAGITGTAAGPMGGFYAADLYRDAYRQLAELSDHLKAYDLKPDK